MPATNSVNYIDTPIREFIEKIGLLNIENYVFESALYGGQASNSFIYCNYKTNEKIVVKILIAPRNDIEFERFKNEIDTLKEIHGIQQRVQKHTSVPKLKIDFSQLKQYPIYYFAMEYIKGITLDKYFEDHSIPWNWENAINFLFRLATSLFYINGRYVHRDLHPKNIMIVSDGYYDRKDAEYKDTGIKILDFGCSRNILKDFYGGQLDDYYRLPGAVSSWSPELLLNPAHVDSKHDTWSLGVLFCRILAGYYPFEMKSLGDILMTYSKSSLDFMKIDQLACPDAVKYLVRNMLDFDPNKRFGIGPIADACNDILNSNLLSMGDEMIKKYFDFRASLVECSRCHELASIRWDKCYKCGTVITHEDVLNLIKYK